ncbi:MAG: aminotransferase class I/II-fold pyridoxal phosphate-dependent enzyme [Gemmatimonadales bacterium]
MRLSIAARVGQLPAYPLAHIPRLKRELIAKGVDVIDLGAGDADFMPPQVAIDSLKAALAKPAMHRYGFQIGLPAFRDAIVRYHRRRFGTELDAAAEVAPLIGSKEGICHFAQAVCGPGDVAIVPEPGYACYIGGTVLAGATPHIVPLTARTSFLVELSDVPAAVLKKTRVVFLNYPNNPTAAVAPKDYLERTVAICREHGIVLCYDNPYCEVTFDGYVAPSIFEIAGAREVAVEFHSMSKSFSMTGWRVAWAIGNRDLISALTQVKTFTDTGPFLALQQASADVLDQAQALVKAPVAAFSSRRDAMARALRKVGFEVPVPKATLYLWVPLPEGVESAEFATVALRDEGVIVLPGTGFGKSAEGYVRIALTVSESRLEEAADRMGRILARA